jgi:putative beta-lysine N-acetyltransferase
MTDRIEKIGNSVIQHGKYNDRVYLMKLDADNTLNVIQAIEILAEGKGYSKIFGKVPESQKDIFGDHGYKLEAIIPGFFSDGQQVSFMGKFLDAERSRTTDADKAAAIIETALEGDTSGNPGNTPEDIDIRQCTTRDISEMVELYKKVFETYPFPIHDPDYIRHTMIHDVAYFGAFKGSSLVGLSSAEMDREDKNVEMTDFAVLPEYRGRDIAMYLLDEMENEMRQRLLNTAYTIARSLSHGMNITFAKLGYTYSGTLLNNTNISGGIESMNVWYKKI